MSAAEPGPLPSLSTATAHRSLGIDFVKCVAIVLVVIVHVSGLSFASFGEGWNATVLWGSLGRDGVPLFFMASGALLLNRPTCPSEIGRRVWRIAVPFIAWSMIYLWWYASLGQTVGQNWFVHILGRGAAGHMWFLYALLGAYLTLPVMVAFHRHAGFGDKVLVLSAWFIGSSVIPTTSDVWGAWSAFSVTYVPLYFGYFLLGALLCDLPRIGTGVSTLLFVAGWIGTGLSTWAFSRVNAAPSELLYLYSSPFVVVSSAGLFLMTLAIGGRMAGTGLVGPVTALAKATFGIYLSHILILNAMLLYLGAIFPSGRTAFILSVSAAVIGASFVATSAIRSVPVLRRICP